MIIVTNTNDSGAGSLRAAIAAAALGEEITFSVTGTITLTTGDLDINQDVIITGPGSGSMTIDGNSASRIFIVNGGVVEITGLRIFNGSADFGGGINNSGTLTLDDIIVIGCSATDQGGGIYNDSTISATNLSVLGCAATNTGGGVFNTGTFTWVTGALTGGLSNSEGGGIYNDGTFTVEQVPMTTNTSISQPGGAVYNLGTIDLTECALTNNTSVGAGMALTTVFGTATFVRCCVSLHSQALSNALQNDGGTLNIRNSTVSTNTNGIFNNVGACDFSNSTIVLNGTGLNQASGSFLTIYNTILAGNTTDYDGDTVDASSLGNNILGVNTNPITPASGDQSVLSFAALLLGALQNNGGITNTHKLLFGSPAIDAGNNASAPSTDQRGTGFPRVVNSLIDIGAFESDVGDEPPGPEPEPPHPDVPPSPQLPDVPAAPTTPSGVWTCPNPPSPCSRPEDPVINSSSEDPDPVTFTSGMTFGFGDWDPGIGRPFARANGCGVTCYRETQEAADACAQALAESCQEDSNPEPDPQLEFPAGGAGTPMPPIPPNVPTIVRPRYRNAEQTAFDSCPDGTVVSYTVPANTFTALTQQQADARAAGQAQQLVVLRKWCIAPIEALHCLNQAITGSFSVSGYNPQSPIQPYPAILVSGTYPPGIQFSQFTPGVWTATGIPTVGGLYTFTIRIINGDQTFKDSTMNMLIWGITTSLADPAVGVPYNVQMVASGNHNSTTWSVTSGTLPPGLELSSSGILSGTPSTSGAFFFIIQAAAENTLGSGQCSREYTLEVASGVSCDVVDNLDWEFTNSAVGGTVVLNTASGGSVHQRVEGGVDTIDNVSAVASGLHENYGPHAIVNLHIVWATNGASEFDTALAINVNSPLFIGWNGWTSPELPGPGTYDIQFVLPDQTNPLNDLQVTVNAVSSGPAFFNEVEVTMTCFCPWDEFTYTINNFPNLGVVEINEGSGGNIHQRVSGNGASCTADSQLLDWIDKGEFPANLRVTWSASGASPANANFDIQFSADSGVLLLASSWDATFPSPGVYNIPITVPAQGPSGSLIITLASQSFGPGEFMDVQVELTCE